MGYDWKRIEQADVELKLSYQECKKIEMLLSVQISLVEQKADKTDKEDLKLIKEYKALHSKFYGFMFKTEQKYYTEE